MLNRLDAVLKFDGSCWPNPGPNSRCAFILHIGTKLIEKSIALGDGTNNTAEYHGLIHGLESALAEGVTHIEVYGDSQIVINGVKKGPWKKGKPHLEALKKQAISLVQQFQFVDLNWVPRDENADADALCG